MATDLELLEIEIETQWGVVDARHRLVEERRPNARAALHLVVATSGDGQIAAVGADVPDALAAELLEIVAGATPSPDPATPPVALDRCARLLGQSLGPVEVASSPSYVVPPGTAFESTAEIRRSDAGDVEALRGLVTDRANWSAEEWQSLLDGALGPWAVATVGDRLGAICHSARLAPRGAEAGVWTDPDFRGLGYAAAVTAAWAALLAPSGRHLFYSTSADNRSSQRVAARLRLRPIGWMWKIVRPRATLSEQVPA